MLSQKARILAYLREHGSITTMDAMRHLNIVNLSGRMTEICRDMPGMITKQRIEEHGNGWSTHHILYRLSNQSGQTEQAGDRNQGGATPTQPPVVADARPRTIETDASGQGLLGAWGRSREDLR